MLVVRGTEPAVTALVASFSKERFTFETPPPFLSADEVGPAIHVKCKDPKLLYEFMAIVHETYAVFASLLDGTIRQWTGVVCPLEAGEQYPIFFKSSEEVEEDVLANDDEDPFAGNCLSFEDKEAVENGIYLAPFDCPEEEYSDMFQFFISQQ